MNSLAVGTFEVTMHAEPPYDLNEGASIGRVSIKKQFSGDLRASSTVEMIGARSLLVKGSAGYVAIERVSGSLHGKSGSFVLQHSGTMTRGKGELRVTVVRVDGHLGPNDHRDQRWQSLLRLRLLVGSAAVSSVIA